MTAKVDWVLETVYQLAAPTQSSDTNMHQADATKECE